MTYNFMNNLKEKSKKTVETTKEFIRKKMYFAGLTSEVIRDEMSKNIIRGKIIDVDIHPFSFIDAHTQYSFIYPPQITYHVGLYTGENLIVDSFNAELNGEFKKGSEVNIITKKYDVIVRDYTSINFKEKQVVSISSLEELVMNSVK